MNFQTSEALEIGVRPEKIAALKAHAQCQRENYTESDIRLAAALMKTACDLSGDDYSDTYKIFNGLLHHAEPTPGHRKLASIVYMCLGRVKMRQEKMAFKPLNPFPKVLSIGRAVLGGVGAVTPDLARTIALLGATTGGVGAAGLWAANRGITQEDDKLREMEIQRDTYNQLNAEVKSELERRKMAPTPTNTAAAVDYLT